MTAQACTIEGNSEDAARKAGALELGVRPDDVSVRQLEEGRYRVAVVRAPSVIEVEVRNGGMEAVVSRITPPTGDSAQPTSAAVVAALKKGGVTSGLLLDEIDKLVAAVVASATERTNVVVARQQLPLAGTDAKITRHYLCPTEEDADRTRLIVRDGELLIEREPAILGESGRTVTGQILEAAAGADPKLPHGDGIVADEEDLRWTTTVPGFGYLELTESEGPRVLPAVTISEDSMQAYLDLRHPNADEPRVTREEVDAAIRATGVVHGLLPERIEAAWRACEEQGALPRPVCIAEGTPPVPGLDADMEIESNPGMSVGAVEAKTDQIDFRERGIVKNVRAGQRIGMWSPATPGVPGQRVDGAELLAVDGKEASYTARENVVATELEDGCVAFEAAIEGILQVRAGNELAVLDFLEIPGDVDYDTGNIDAKGSVLVRGTVRSEFRVTAKHDITVRGSVEDATVTAGGVVFIEKGIFGGERGRVSAEERVSVKFAQNASIVCDGDVEIRDSDTNSVIECRGRLIATQGHGHLRGGRYTAFGGVEAQELGSELGVTTAVSVGTDPVLASELHDVREALREAQKKGRKGVEKVLKARQTDLEGRLFAETLPTIKVLGVVHGGVDIYIRRVHLHTDGVVEHVRFRYDPQSRQIEVEPL